MKKPSLETGVRIAKGVTTIVVSIGVNRIISGIVDNNVETTKTKDRVAVAAGSYALSAMVADAASSYTDRAIDDLVNQVLIILRKAPNPAKADTDEPIETLSEGIIVETVVDPS